MVRYPMLVAFAVISAAIAVSAEFFPGIPVQRNDEVEEIVPILDRLIFGRFKRVETKLAKLEEENLKATIRREVFEDLDGSRDNPKNSNCELKQKITNLEAKIEDLENKIENFGTTKNPESVAPTTNANGLILRTLTQSVENLMENQASIISKLEKLEEEKKADEMLNEKFIKANSDFIRFPGYPSIADYITKFNNGEVDDNDGLDPQVFKDLNNFGRENTELTTPSPTVMSETSKIFPDSQFDKRFDVSETRKWIWESDDDDDESLFWG